MGTVGPVCSVLDADVRTSVVYASSVSQMDGTVLRDMDSIGSLQRLLAAHCAALWLNEARQQLLTPLRFGKALVAMYPLLGLLGTVTGMIAVFDVLAINGNGDPRGMAAGVWKATIPTMAGMVLAISGLFSLARLERLANLALERLADQLRND